MTATFDPVAAPLRRSSAGRAKRLASSPSLHLIGRRVLIAIPVLWGVTFLTFLVMNALPGDAATELVGADATRSELAAVKARLGLDHSVWMRYGHWLNQLVLHASLGNSLDGNQSVASIIGSRFPLTLELVAYAFVLSLVLAVPIALMAARKPGGIADRISMVISMAGLSIAPFVLALVLILVFSVNYNVFPAIYPTGNQGFLATLYDLFVPAVAFAFPLFCFYTRFMRAEILEQMQREEYIVAARAKGISENRLLLRHAMRNSLFGFLTIIGLNVGTLIAGTVIVEAIFSIPGLGEELLTAIGDRDLPVVQGIVVIYACFAVFANLFTDVLYAVADPRIRYGRSAV